MTTSLRRTTTAAALVLGCLAITGPAVGQSAATPASHTHRVGPATSVPKGFKANSMSWLSRSSGFVLGAGRCSGSPCARVISTTDAGKTWNLVGSIPTPLVKAGKARQGVTEVRYGTTQIAWAFAPQLWLTTDGGATWSRQTIPGGGKQVLVLAAGSHSTYMVVSQCGYGAGICGKPLTLWRSPNREPGTWHRVRHIDLPDNVMADVSMYGKTVYVVDDQLIFGHPGKFYASTDGRHFDAVKSPCSHKQDLALFQAVPTSATGVDVLCDGNPGFSKAVKTVYRSTDNGSTFTYAGQMGLYGIQAQLTVSPSGNLLVASWSDGSFIYTNNGGGQTWAMPVGLGDGGAGWNDVHYVTDKTAWVVYAPADFYPGTGQLYVTHDSGQTWAPVTL